MKSEEFNGFTYHTFQIQNFQYRRYDTLYNS